MGVTVAVTRDAADIDAAPYTQDFTSADLGGLTPSAALFIVTCATADGTATADASLCIGAATGAANEWCLATSDEDGEGTTDSAWRTNDTECVQILQSGTSTVDGEAEFNSFIANGVRINWTDAPSAAFLITVVLFAGTDLTAHADNEDLGDALNNAVNVTNPNFEPDLVIAAVIDYGDNSASGSNSKLSVGAVHNGASVTQRCFAFYSKDAQATSEIASRFTESYGVMAIWDNGTLDWGGEFSDFDAQGFTCTTRNAGANGTYLFYLALYFGGVADSWVGTVDTPTSTGNDAQTGPNFRPQFVMQGMTHAEAVDTAYTDGRAGAIGLSAFDADDEYSNSIAMEDNAGTSNTQCVSDDMAVNLDQDDGTNGHEAAFVSFGATGWTLNFSATLGTAKKWWGLAIEGEGGVVPLAMNHFRRLREQG